jgi:hypothetical protein
MVLCQDCMELTSGHCWRHPVEVIHLGLQRDVMNGDADDVPPYQSVVLTKEKEADLRLIIAGLLSTIEFTPSKHHPETMLPWADKILTLFKPLAPN